MSAPYYTNRLALFKLLHAVEEQAAFPRSWIETRVTRDDPMYDPSGWSDQPRSRSRISIGETTRLGNETPTLQFANEDAFSVHLETHDLNEGDRADDHVPKLREPSPCPMCIFFLSISSAWDVQVLRIELRQRRWWWKNAITTHDDPCADIALAVWRLLVKFAAGFYRREANIRWFRAQFNGRPFLTFDEQRYLQATLEGTHGFNW